MVNILFKEEQRFRRNLLWLILLVAPAFILLLLIFQRFSGVLIFERNLPDGALFLVTFFFLVPAALSLYAIKLTTIIDAEKISFGWNVPNNRLNEIPLNDIDTCEIVEYKFVGYGYRLSNRYGTIYNVTGNQGLQIITKAGGKVLIGTNQPEELKKTITQINNQL